MDQDFLDCFGRNALSYNRRSRIDNESQHYAGLPRSGKKIWKMKFFPGQGKVREFCGWPGKFKKDLESQGKVRELENKELWQAVFKKFVQEGEGCTFS